MSFRPERLRRSRSRLRGRDGFTLIEVLVAFSVMGLLLSVLFRGVVTMRAGSNTFDDRTHADLVARAVLDEASAHRDMRPGTRSGLRDGRRWTLTMRPLDLSAQLPPPTAVPSPSAGATPAGAPNPATPSSQGQLNTASATPSAPNPVETKPSWVPQRLMVRVETNGRPVDVETIRLVRAE